LLVTFLIWLSSHWANKVTNYDVMKSISVEL